jgi:hypothetical protein
MAYTILPEYQRELYKEVKGARYVGYETSVTNIGAALAAKVKPKPMRKLLLWSEMTREVTRDHTHRAPMNMPTD